MAEHSLEDANRAWLNSPFWVLCSQFPCACFECDHANSKLPALYTSCGNENKVLARKTCQKVLKEWAAKNIFKQISWMLSCCTVPAPKHIVTVMIYILTEIVPHCSFHFWSIMHFKSKNRWNNSKHWVLKKYSECINMNLQIFKSENDESYIKHFQSLS